MSVDSLALLIAFLFVSLIGFLGIAALIIFVSRDTTKIPEILVRLTQTEKLVAELVSDVNAESNLPIHESWRTADGRYEASSFEELLTKMTQDPNSPLTVDEIESIKSVFEKIMGESDDESDF